MKTTLFALLFTLLFTGCSSNTVSLPKGTDTATIYRLAQEQQSLREFHQAAKLYRQAANKGHAGAQYSLGYLYSKAWGVNHDRAKAIHWYRKSAAQNNADAQYNLGVIYDKGYGVKQDYKRASVWYLKAAIQNHMKASNNLGYMYSHGLGVKKSYDEAEKWYQKSINLGSYPAKVNLAEMNKEMNSHLSSFTIIRDKNGKVINAFSTPPEKPL